MLASFKGQKDGLLREKYHWNFIQSLTRMCVERAFEECTQLGFDMVVLHNMCIIFGDVFWRQEWMREATDEMHNGLSIPKIMGSSMRKRMAVANLALHMFVHVQFGGYWRQLARDSKIHKTRKCGHLWNCNRHNWKIIQIIVDKIK